MTAPLCRNCFRAVPLNDDHRCGTCVGEMVRMRAREWLERDGVRIASLESQLTALRGALKAACLRLDSHYEDRRTSGQPLVDPEILAWLNLADGNE